MKVSLHKILEEILGISKINTKEELNELLKDKKRLAEVVRIIKLAGAKKEETAI